MLHVLDEQGTVSSHARRSMTALIRRWWWEGVIVWVVPCMVLGVRAMVVGNNHVVLLEGEGREIFR